MKLKSRETYLVVMTVLCTLAIVFAGILFQNKFFPSNITYGPGEVPSSQIKKFNDVRQILKDHYFENLDQSILLEGALKGMVDSIGDRYTSYLTKAEWDKRKENFSGEYKGVGITFSIQPDGKIEIATVIAHSPALSAGLKFGDIIEKVDGVNLTKDSNVEKMFKENGRNDVVLTVYRPSSKERFDKKIVKDVINVQNVTSKMIDGNVGYVDLVMFDQNISEDFITQVTKLKNEGAKGIIIDVRNNRGGDLNQVVKLCDFLLPKCTIVSVQNRNEAKQFYYSDEKSFDLPVTILINENSASASEVLTAAIHDNNRGTLIGEKTFGKGWVQDNVEFGDGSAIYFTIARYFTPAGVCIHGIGIEPDIKVALPKEYVDHDIKDIPMAEDTQLQTALTNIKSKIK